MFACAVELVREGKPAAATALLVGFDCYLRHGELLGIRGSDVVFAGDPRVVMQSGALAALCLGKTKVGRPQWTFVRCRLAAKALRLLMRRKSPNSFLFVVQGGLLGWFKFAQRSLGFEAAVFVIHSLRHGGATNDFLNGVLKIDQIMLRGRWSGMDVTKRYVQESQAFLLSLRIPEIVHGRVALYNSDITKWLF